jgi:hypothetical protein
VYVIKKNTGQWFYREGEGNNFVQDVTEATKFRVGAEAEKVRLSVPLLAESFKVERTA